MDTKSEALATENAEDTEGEAGLGTNCRWRDMASWYT